MSRIGKLPLEIKEGITIKLEPGLVEVTGPKGTLKRTIRPEISLKQEGSALLVSRRDNGATSKALHGLVRSLVKNMLIGVTEGFTKTLQIIGTGYRVNLEGENLVIHCGFSHPVTIKPEPGIKFSTADNGLIIISGIDKELVGQVSAQIRAVKPPEPYKGKGIRYQDEVVKRKAGKAGKAGAATGA